MTNLIIILTVLLLSGSALLYLYRQKKKGKKCLGCADCTHCPGCNQVKN